MTSLLPPPVIDPFHPRLERKLNFFRRSIDLVSPASTLPGEFFKGAVDYSSPVSAAPELRSVDQNVRIDGKDTCTTPAGSAEAKSRLNSTSKPPEGLQKHSKSNHTTRWRAKFSQRERQTSQSAEAVELVRKQADLQSTFTPGTRLQRNTPTRRNKQSSQSFTTPHNSRSLTDSHGHCLGEFLEPFPILNGPDLSKTRALHSTPTKQKQISFKHELIQELPPIGLHGEHRQRQSDASSDFVRTVKTASMSNVSFSIAPRSTRIRRSSESQTCFRGMTRLSLDSERPNAGSVVDEAALRRAVKRKDIINELIMTEESYVADLKALLYLYSTLLASAATVPNQIRSAVQRNVTEILHIHEDLLDKLHKAAFMSAARKWAATEELGRPDRGRQINSKLTRLRARSGFAKKHNRTRRSLDSTDLSRTNVMVGTSDPSDVLDLAEVLTQVMTSLFAYEEYCANHRVIAYELQKGTPQLWSTYQSGMESLSRHVVSLDRRKQQDRKGLTVADLLIKPVQRICKYPLLLDDLLKNTPVIDGPAAHRALDDVLNHFRDIVRTVNLATDNPITRGQLQRKWLLQDRLIIRKETLSYDQFRLLGSVQLCGVLHATYRTDVSNVEGGYMTSVLFDNHILLAVPLIKTTKLELFTIISLSDLRIESADTGGGLQCSTPFTWKITFHAHDSLYEIMLSACSRAEQEQWLLGLRGVFRPVHYLHISTMFDQSKIFKNLHPLGPTFHLFTPMSCRSAKQQAATSEEHATVCQVILKNTHNLQDLNEWRNTTSPAVDTSVNNVSKDLVVLSPKRAERTRLEASIGDIYTQERLPFPGMIASKSSQIIRASAGSLARKLSFASMHASFSRRSASLSSKKSYHTVHTVSKQTPTFSVKKRSFESFTPNRNGKLQELPELDTMHSVVGRMIGGETAKKRLSFSNGEKLIRKSTRTSQRRNDSSHQVGPEDPAIVFYKDNGIVEEIEKQVEQELAKAEGDTVAEGLSGVGRKRWSNPMTKLRGIGSDRIRNMLYSSK